MHTCTLLGLRGKMKKNTWARENHVTGGPSFFFPEFSGNSILLFSFFNPLVHGVSMCMTESCRFV